MAFAGTLTGCAGRQPYKIPTDAVPPSIGYRYVDLQPGWRISVVTPILKSGKFIIDSRAIERSGNEIIIKTGNDFVGYDRAYYSIKAQPGGGVFIRFSSAETIKDGKAAKQSRPLVPLFNLPANMRFVRLLFLIRVSEADHDQGILAASSLQQLNALTQSVEDDPTTNCRTYAEAVCSWIPAGIAAQPEKRDPVHRNEWVPTW